MYTAIYNHKVGVSGLLTNRTRTLIATPYLSFRIVALRKFKSLLHIFVKSPPFRHCPRPMANAFFLLPLSPLSRTHVVRQRDWKAKNSRCFPFPPFFLATEFGPHAGLVLVVRSRAMSTRKVAQYYIYCT